MARPALVIGLGGTGQWVLTYLKKDLLEIGNGELPPGIRLLSFDTLKHASAIAGHDSQLVKDTKDTREKKAGAVELENKTEFIHFGSNLNELAQEINQGKHSHLSWFDASEAIKKLPLAALNADDGAGAIRQVGRLCLVNDVQVRATSKIIATIQNAIARISEDTLVSETNRLEILIIGSLAGGTGAGMLVDIPLLCRKIAGENFAGNIIVRGFIVTPRAFVAGVMGEGRSMLARSFAAWRELDRFLITSSEYGTNEIKYSAKDPYLTLATERRLYDSTYIIDPLRKNNPLDPGKPEEGLYAAIANVISAIVDDTAGMAYSEQTINLSDTYIRLPLIPTHSAVGSFMMKVPVFYAQQKFTHNLAKDVLDVLLVPIFNDHGRIIRLSETSNAEVTQDKIGIDAVTDFLNSDTLQFNAETIPNTQLSKLIAKVRKNDAQDDGKVITTIARGGLSRSNAEFILAMTDVEQDEEGSVVTGDMTKEIKFNVWQKVPPSREHGDTPDQAYNRITKGVSRVRTEHYGIEKAEEGKRGSFGEELEQAKFAQLRLFSALLRAWTEKTLNGESVNIRMSRGGKLGYVKSFYKNMIDTFVYFNGFLDKVNVKRSEDLHIEEKVTKAETNAMQLYNEKKSKGCWLTFWDNFIHPEAYRVQRNYLMAAQRTNNYRKDKLLLIVIEETVNEMKSFVQNTLNDINQWEKCLATGDTKRVDLPDGASTQMEIVSLYHGIQTELNNIEVNHKLDKDLGKVSAVVGEIEYQNEPSFVNDRLQKIIWQVERDEIKVTQIDGKEFTKVKGMNIKLLLSDPFEVQLRSKGEKAISYNLPAFLQLTAQPYANLVQDHRFATEILRGDLNTGNNLAEFVHQKSDPLYRPTATGMGPMHSPPSSRLIRVQSKDNAETQELYKQLGIQLNELEPGVRNTLVDSDDSYKQTIVRFDDVIKSEDFDMWQRCHDAYVELANDPGFELNPADLHIYQAEINACNYEKKISETLKKNYRILHPDVVALLQDDQRTEMFFRALALGLINKVDTQDGKSYWVYQISGDSEVHLTEPQVGFGVRDDKDYFRLINQFVVRGEDIRPGYTQVHWIDFERLNEEILAQHRKHGADEVSKLYKEQTKLKSGMVQEIRNYIKRERAQIKDPNLRAAVAKDHEDLTDLAETIYLIAADQG